jgi:hypothetical protein
MEEMPIVGHEKGRSHGKSHPSIRGKEVPVYQDPPSGLKAKYLR